MFLQFDSLIWSPWPIQKVQAQLPKLLKLLQCYWFHPKLPTSFPSEPRLNSLPLLFPWVQLVLMSTLFFLGLEIHLEDFKIAIWWNWMKDTFTKCKASTSNCSYESGRMTVLVVNHLKLLFNFTYNWTVPFPSRNSRFNMKWLFLRFFLLKVLSCLLIERMNEKGIFFFFHVLQSFIICLIPIFSNPVNLGALNLKEIHINFNLWMDIRLFLVRDKGLIFFKLN